MIKATTRTTLPARTKRGYQTIFGAHIERNEVMCHLARLVIRTSAVHRCPLQPPSPDAGTRQGRTSLLFSGPNPHSYQLHYVALSSPFLTTSIPVSGTDPVHLLVPPLSTFLTTLKEEHPKTQKSKRLRTRELPISLACLAWKDWPPSSRWAIDG